MHRAQLSNQSNSAIERSDDTFDWKSIDQQLIWRDLSIIVRTRSYSEEGVLRPKYVIKNTKYSPSFEFLVNRTQPAAYLKH